MCDFRAAVSLVREKPGIQLSNRKMLSKVSVMMKLAGNAQPAAFGRALGLCNDDRISRF